MSEQPDVARFTVSREQNPADEFRDLFSDAVEREKKQLDNDLVKATIKDRKSDRRLRRRYANRILYYLETYSIVVGAFVLFDGWDILGFTLDPKIIAALVGSTAIAAIGLVGFIAKGLFK